MVMYVISVRTGENKMICRDGQKEISIFSPLMECHNLLLAKILPSHKSYISLMQKGAGESYFQISPIFYTTFACSLQYQSGEHVGN